MGNRLLFPASPSTYKAEDIPGLFWVPEDIGQPGTRLTAEELKSYYTSDSDKTTSRWIPCQYLPASSYLGEKHLILYFHGNSCDMGDMTEEMSIVHQNTGRHVVQFEYPGYGICQKELLSPLPKTIDAWSRAVATFLIACGMPASQLILMGRSIGTGPAARLARYLCDLHGAIGALVLHSPYISIHAIVTDYAFKPGTYLVPNYWDTAEELKVLAKKNVPLLIIHGMADEVIAVRHGKELLDNYEVAPNRKKGVFPTSSEHNFYFVMEDIVYPLRQFIAETSRDSFAGMKDIVPDWAETKPEGAADVGCGGPTNYLGRNGDTANRSRDLIRSLNDNSNILSRFLFCGCASPRPETPDNIHR